jgi:transcriptional regulator with XRE-family HTH domain
MKPTYVAQLEHEGIATPGYEAMRGIAKGLRVPEAWLTGEDATEPEWDDVDHV